MDELPGFPPRPNLQLAPGLRVVGRGHDHLQIGLYDGRRALLPRTGVVESTVEALLARRPLEPDQATASVLDRLQRGGCLAARDEDMARERRRRQGRVGVLGAAGATDATALLEAAGATVVEPGLGAHVVLVLSTGEIARDRLDPLIRSATTHLVVRLVDGAALIGPFVVPGLTACLRCIDAHRSIHDPDHVAVTSRYVAATTRVRADGVPDVTDPVLAAVAVAWAVRDVVAHLEGRRPSTWSRTLFLDPEPSRRHEEVWSTHPECGCCWSAMDPTSGTMEV
jgi:bacteriocin biosynthesis cyclodehydratase domain-containing protein